MSIPGSPTQQWIFAMVVVAGVGMVAVQQKKAPEPNKPAPAVEVIEAPKINEPPVADVVRIDGTMATIAGTGTPGEEIIIMDGTKEIARVTVGPDGTYAAVFDYKVPNGGANLEVVETTESGELNRAKNSIAVLPVGDTSPTIAKLEGDVIKVEVDNRDKLTFAGIVYGDGDDAVISGNSTPNTSIAVTLDGQPSGYAPVGADGAWKLSLANLTVGAHKLGLSSDDGQAFEVEIERAAIEVVQTITRGDTLWRIAELRLGDGRRYTDIYNLNADKINDPDLIFPEQDLIIPPK